MKRNLPSETIDKLLSLSSKLNHTLVRVHRLVRQDDQGRTFYFGFDDGKDRPVFPQDFIEDAALVEVEVGLEPHKALDRAWYFTNHVDQDWTTHTNVIVNIPEEFDAEGELTDRSFHARRSSMVGDAFELPDGSIFLVEMAGFSPLERKAS
jgi:hypothetical protein